MRRLINQNEEIKKMKTKGYVYVAVLWCLFMAPAMADWYEGDPYKMHYPQLPDPNGWDVKYDEGVRIADDWQCSQSGPVTDIHFWGSWKQDVKGTIDGVNVRIYSDQPAEVDQYSRPLDELWERGFTAAEIKVTEDYGAGDQGWYDPIQGVSARPDHIYYYQVNITDIADPFFQEKDTIYWLELQVNAVGGETGWKTSGAEHFNDDSVHWLDGVGWQELRDPVTNDSLDQAFVVVPEPGSLVLGIATLIAVGFVRRWRRR